VDRRKGGVAKNDQKGRSSAYRQALPLVLMIFCIPELADAIVSTIWEFVASTERQRIDVSKTSG
jgi:hypothetical protein